MTEPRKAVFLSYASQDVEAAQRICDALRTAGIEVWFDQSELRGGDAWDQKIRREIHDCFLFIPVISTNTASRHEGYFRLEWDLADQRSHMMARNRVFILPVSVDTTADAGADVPDSFLRVQWTRLPAGTTEPAFIKRVTTLLSLPLVPANAEGSTQGSTAADAQVASPAPAKPTVRRTQVAVLGATALLVAAGYLAEHKLALTKRLSSSAGDVASAQSVPGQTAIPEKSIAVLPFVNMSADKDQEYFSDGLTEELIDLLGQVPDLHVPARTSSFYFKGRNETITSVAQQLKVAHVLEGSVRKAGKLLRITAQLIRADNGYRLWSQIYDRDDADIFAVQDDIAKAVVKALQVKLAAGVQGTGSPGTTNIEAYNEYLLGRQFERSENLDSDRSAVEAYRKAVALDPDYAAAYAGLALVEANVADFTGHTEEIEHAVIDVDKAISLAPEEAGGYATRSTLRTVWLRDWQGAQADIEKALTLDPRSGDVQRQYASLLDTRGRLPEAISAEKLTTEFDPLSGKAWGFLGYLYTEAGDYVAADAAISRATQIQPSSAYFLTYLGMLRLLQGRPQEALELFRKVDQEGFRLTGIAMAEHTLGHARDSQQALDRLIAKHAQDGPYQVATVYGWRGETDLAFLWLDRAYKQRDGGLANIKTDPMLKSLHGDPRFKSFLSRMNIPD
jgi:TolB-like protein